MVFLIERNQGVYIRTLFQIILQQKLYIDINI